ncbi:DUF4126 family protein [Rhodanobacter sp. DHB23]|uniref:DUF4126 family protein n=1 Tax=Rhodanobacter sp. DHB23 TaxID=2775923 RepID=UPI00177BFF35|nr:DUF4126 family protein [Rhodanobacter sp. DHB23]MBD8873670.1 DUF4126 family protein [Rhodanobacter sp. DHB23]
MLIGLMVLFIGVIAGLRAMTAPALASWAAWLDWLPLHDTPLAFMGYAYTPWILTLLALVELANDKLPTTPSRKIPVQFATRVVAGAWSGATLMGAHGNLWLGAIIGACGAVIGTLVCYRSRHSLALHFGGRDLFAVLAEDAVAIGGGILIVLTLA